MAECCGAGLEVDACSVINASATPWAKLRQKVEGGWAPSAGVDVPGDGAEILSQLPGRWHRCPPKDLWSRRSFCRLAAKRKDFMIPVTQRRRE